MAESPPVSPPGLRKEGSKGLPRDRRALAAESAPSSMNFFRSTVQELLLGSSGSEFRPHLVSEETKTFVFKSGLSVSSDNIGVVL